MQGSPLKVLHFVAGGFTGSTAVAIDLVNATKDRPDIVSRLVLRKRPTTDINQVKRLHDAGVPVTLISGGLKLITIIRLCFICRKFKPDILVAHGFTEHLWGRYAGLLAGVPHLVHVEHNSRENYSWWRLLQAHFLTRYTSAIIACAQGVKIQLEKLRFPVCKIAVITNGISLERFEAADNHPFVNRVQGIVMPARFGKQKDHTTVIKALAILRDKGITVPTTFAGLGHPRYLKNAKELTQSLQLEQQITFAGHVNNLPELLTQHQICLLSSRYEGMPIALAEGMAAGCAVIGSAVPGIQEMIQTEKDGLLVIPNSPEDLALAIERLLTDQTFAQNLATAARQRAMAEFSLTRMRDQYESLYFTLNNRRDVESHLAH